jgi:transposase
MVLTIFALNLTVKIAFIPAFVHHVFLTRTENPLKKKQSLIALSCKLIRVLFALGKKKMPYDGRKLLKDSSIDLLQEAA